jgi:uracil-DNA glycosylase
MDRSITFTVTLLMHDLINRIQQCRQCADHLPHGPRPVVQLNTKSKIIIIGQAPGRRVHETGIPWNDPSGRTLRHWLNVDEELFYNPEVFSIMPMGFCYPSKGSSGDLAPRTECAPLWHGEIFKHFTDQPLILLIGQYAQRYYLKNDCKSNLTDTVMHYKQYLPRYFPLPHPSPRNRNWVKINPWFEAEVLPELRRQVAEMRIN